MEEAAAVRKSARATVDDIEPACLRDVLLSVIDTGSMVPGVLTLLTARLCSGSSDGLEQCAAGVQLIYDGLRLTRQLAHEEPWERTARADADVQILAADVLVARGFYLLARTDAAPTAVDVVRSFGRDQTSRRERDEPSLDAHLERDVLELALTTGGEATDRDIDADLCALADDLVSGCEDGFPESDVLFSDAVTQRLSRTVAQATLDT